MKTGSNRNSARPGGCNAAALVPDEDVLQQAIRIGDRATRRTAQRNLQKLRNSAPKQAVAA